MHANETREICKKMQAMHEYTLYQNKDTRVLFMKYMVHTAADWRVMCTCMCLMCIFMSVEHTEAMYQAFSKIYRVVYWMHACFVNLYNELYHSFYYYVASL